MQAQIKSLYPLKSHFREVDIFGYTSRGVPGLEIIGLGRINRKTKEKLLYLTRLYHLRLPMRRFVLCIEDDNLLREVSLENRRWLELPLLILFWTLAGVIPIHRLENCWTAGKVSSDGGVEFIPLEQGHLLSVLDQLNFPHQGRWIAPEGHQIPKELLHLPLEALISNQVGLQLN